MEDELSNISSYGRRRECIPIEATHKVASRASWMRLALPVILQQPYRLIDLGLYQLVQKGGRRHGGPAFHRRHVLCGLRLCV